MIVACLLAVGAIPPAAQAQDDFKRYLTAAVSLYKSLEYERAMEQLQRAKGQAKGIGQDVTVALHEGIVLADMGKREGSLVAFKTALLLDPESKLPFKISPKVERDFEELRTRVRAELAKNPDPAPPPSPPPAPAAGTQQPIPPVRETEPQEAASKDPVQLPPPVSESAQPSPIDSTKLLTRVADYYVQLRQRDDQAINSPAMAQLMEIREQLASAATLEQQMEVVERLDEWERQYLLPLGAFARAALTAPPSTGHAPSGANSIQLRPGDINTVLVAHRPEVKECVKVQREKEPGVHGKMVMSWIIKTDGSTKDVSCISKELCSMYLASCLTALIQGWTFPVHTVEGKPMKVEFAF